MSLKRYDAKRDKNEPEIVEALKQAGASVVRLSMPDVSDLLCAYAGTTFLVEIKTDEGRLTKGQTEFIKVWQGKVYVVRSVEGALEIIETLRKLPIYASRSAPLSWHIQ